MSWSNSYRRLDNLPVDWREFGREPLKLVKFGWPHYRLYDKQRDLFHSVWDNKVTLAPAGHKLGKDFDAALINLVFFLTRHPCRVLTSSVDGKQLDGVLWGEMRRHIQECRIPLTVEKGGCLVVNHQMIRKVYNGEMCGLSYIMGRVAEKGEGLSGHHIAQTGDGIPRTLACADECSGMDETSLDKMTEWADRYLMIGNPYECQNSFKWGVKGKPGKDGYHGGDLPRPDGRPGYLRRIIRIKAEDSPNVKYAMAEIAAGKKPSGRIIIPGVLPYDDYVWARTHWDEKKQMAGLDADWYEGAGVLMFPPDWLNRAETLAESLRGRRRVGKGLGVDPAEGGDNTAYTVVDEHGIVHMFSHKTIDTDKVIGQTLALMREYQVPADKVCFDRGGGGKQHADRLRKMGHPVRTIGFGEAVALQIKHGKNPVPLRREVREEKYAYKNRRAQMYGELRELLNPVNKRGFAIGREWSELRHQLGVIPLEYDGEGRMVLLSKHADDDEKPSLTKLIGHSPDEADSLVLAVHAMVHKAHRATAGAA
jgi:hypothetical protein